MIKHHAFTTRYNGLTSTIITDISIQEPLSGNELKEGIKALWDTGATGSVISKNIVKQLGLIPTGKTLASGIHSTIEVNTYIINVILPNGVRVQDVRVTESSNFDHFDVLVGMNIIALGDFAFTNKNSKSFFSFRVPSVEHIDFVPISIDHNLKANGLNRKQRRNAKKRRK
jgi:hypothetical protein